MVIKYSDTVIDHFRNPRNMGEMDDPDGVGNVGNPTCGDIMIIYIKVKKNKITDISFKTFGCAAAIATSSMITTIAKGKTLEEAEQISRNDVAVNLNGLPDLKIHCSNLAADALKKAIQDYRQKKKGNIDG
jgi:nitrogen fixation NifU-like protein